MWITIGNQFVNPLFYTKAKGWQLAFGLDLSYVVPQSTQRLHNTYWNPYETNMLILMINQPSSQATLARMEVHYDKARIIDAVSVNCNRRFKSMRGVNIHSKMTTACHVVNFIDYGNYGKKRFRNESSRNLKWILTAKVGNIHRKWDVVCHLRSI
jgi:hypothetical protein